MVFSTVFQSYQDQGEAADNERPNQERLDQQASVLPTEILGLLHILKICMVLAIYMLGSELTWI